jgi:hypothetical protein
MSDYNYVGSSPMYYCTMDEVAVMQSWLALARPAYPEAKIFKIVA